MRAAASVILTVGGLVALGFVLRDALPHSLVIAVEWQGQEYYIPYNIIGFWACVIVGAVAGTIQMIRAMIGNMERLR